MNVLLAFTFLACFSLSSAVFKSNCGVPAIAKVTSVSIDGCKADAQACELPPDTDVSVSIKFFTYKTADKLTGNVTIYYKKLEVETTDPDACKDVAEGCPLEEKKEYTYTTKFHVDPKIPRQSTVQVYVRLFDPEKDVFCIWFLVKPTKKN